MQCTVVYYKPCTSRIPTPRTALACLLRSGQNEQLIHRGIRRYNLPLSNTRTPLPIEHEDFVNARTHARLLVAKAVAHRPTIALELKAEEEVRMRLAEEQKERQKLARIAAEEAHRRAEQAEHLRRVRAQERLDRRRERRREMKEVAIAAAQAAQKEKARKAEETTKRRQAQASAESITPSSSSPSPRPQPIWKPKVTSTDKALDRLLLGPDELTFRKARLVDPEDYPDNTQAQEVLEQFKARNNSVYMMHDQSHNAIAKFLESPSGFNLKGHRPHRAEFYDTDRQSSTLIKLWTNSVKDRPTHQVWVGQNSKYEHDNIRVENQGVTRPIGLIHQTWHPTKWVFDIALIARDKDDDVIGAIELATVWDDPKEDLVIMKDKKRREVARIQRFAASWLDVKTTIQLSPHTKETQIDAPSARHVRMMYLACAAWVGLKLYEHPLIGPKKDPWEVTLKDDNNDQK